ncbi:MAG: hypothetical protein SGI83_08525 [Bacteroidota bacterium]|nr:hypothetical protein [Bacteroidota bacterium]
MKKFFAVLALVGVMTSCKDKKKEEEKKPEETTVPTTDPTSTVPTSTGVPTFSDPDVTAYVKAYEDYIAVYKKAAESKDMTKMAELGTMGQDLATKATAATQKLVSNPEDAKKLADYMTAKAAEIMELSKKLTGQ